MTNAKNTEPTQLNTTTFFELVNNRIKDCRDNLFCIGVSQLIIVCRNLRYQFASDHWFT